MNSALMNGIENEVEGEEECAVEGKDIKATTEKTVKQISEYCALRNLIWTLSSPGRSQEVLTFNSGKHRLRSDVCVSSVTPEYWNLNVSSLARLADSVFTLDSWCSNLSSKRKTDPVVPCSYVAYSHSVQGLLQKYRQRLNYYEAIVCQQEKFVSIDSLMCLLLPWSSLIPALVTVHEKAIMTDWQCQENWKCTLHLLATLLQSMRTAKKSLRISLFKIFLETIRPYFVIVDNWLSNATMIDSKDEFLISRSNVAQSGNLIIKDYPSFLYGVTEKNEFFDNFVYHVNKACSSVDFLTLLQRDSYIPDQNEPLNDSFIKRVINEVKDYPKSNAFTESIFHDAVLTEEPDKSISDDNPCRTGFFNWADEMHEEMKLTCSWATPRTDKMVREDTLNLLYSLDLDSAPLDIILQQCCTDTISSVMQPKGFARDILLLDYRFGDHLAALRAVFLFEDGVHMPEVCLAVASQSLRPKELESLLPEAPNLFVVSPRPGRQVSGSASVNLIHINYIRQPPLNLIIRDAAIERYNELFRLLLKVKWAVHQLTGTRMKSMWSRQDTVMACRLFSLRVFMLHTVSTIHQYIIAAVSAGDDKVLAVCSVARDVQIIASKLEQCLDLLRRRCFLLGGTQIADCIFTLLTAADELRSLWDTAEWDNQVERRIASLESLYQETVNNLAETITDLSTSRVFKEFSHFEHLSNELRHNMPGDWDS